VKHENLICDDSFTLWQSSSGKTHTHRVATIVFEAAVKLTKVMTISYMT